MYILNKFENLLRSRSDVEYDVRNEPNKDKPTSKIYKFGGLGYEVKVNKRIRDYNWFNLIRGGHNYITSEPTSWTRSTGYGRVFEFGKLALRFKKIGA